ncbi:MAG: DUF1573 domain-containing protein [Ignavibacteria bacterium]|nr:DUF1573 domain-containing protein [Ignavibacteria bacterium]
MKKVFKSVILIFFIVMAFVSCQNNQTNLPADLVHNPKSASGDEKINLPEISFNNTEHDFGMLIQGEIVSHTFKFTNSGSADLIISKVSASCGCTASKYTQEPVNKGQEGKIEVIFDSNGQKGIINKTITVLTNGKTNSIVLRIKAQVKTPESY